MARHEKTQASGNDQLATLRADFDRELAALGEPGAGNDLRRAFAATPDELSRAANATASAHRAAGSKAHDLIEHLDTIERIAASVGRKHLVDPDAVAEFTREAKFRLLEDEHALIRKFDGRSSFSTYLTAVIQRLYQQYRVEQWGKWRSSDDVAAEAVAVEADAVDRGEAMDRERAARSVAAALDRVMETFDAEDRMILQLCFWRAQKVPEIARTLQMDQKKIYERLDTSFAQMRAALEREGISRQDIDRLLSHLNQDLRSGLATDAARKA